MKRNILTTLIAPALFAGAISIISIVPAQVTETTTTTTITTTGTIAELDPEALIVRSPTVADPLRYAYSERTTYVDATGAPVARETLRSGLPVTVHYRKLGGTLIADRVIVGGAAPPAAIETRTATATTAMGTVADFGPGTIAVRTEAAADPLRYTYSEATTYVDETGAPVAIETVRSGLPVTVHYTQVGNELIANRVIVRRQAVVVPAPAPIIEERRTTTTTIPAPVIDDDDDDDDN